MRRGVVQCQPALAMRVFTRPVIGRSFPAQDRGVDAIFRSRLTSGVFAPGSLAPLRSPVPRVRRHIRASSWPLRFPSPEALAAPLVSPRNQHGSHRPSRGEGWLLGHAPVANGLLNRRKEDHSRVLKRCSHADQRPDILSSDVSRSPSVRAKSIVRAESLPRTKCGFRFR